MKKQLLSLLLSVAMLIGVVPTTVQAQQDYGEVRVIVENTTYTTAAGAPWDGVLIDDQITLSADSTMMSCIVQALAENGYTQEGAEYGYISAVNGIAAMDGSFEAGWMGSLNDWFVNAGFDAFCVADQTLSAGDEIRLMYTCVGYGADLGADWFSTDTSLKALSISSGTLSPVFDSQTKAYTLTLPAGTQSMVLTPTASNKNNKVLIKIGDTEYKRSSHIPVQTGTVITVTVDSGAGANNETYTISVEVEQSDPQFAASNTIALIDAIGTVTKQSEAAITAARAAYDALSPESQALVTNYQILTDAEARLAQLQAQGGSGAGGAVITPTTKQIYNNTLNYLQDAAKDSTPIVNAVGGEWLVLALARSERDVPRGYVNNVVSFVKQNIDEYGRLDHSKSTENSRVILALTAIGKDVTNIGGHNLLRGLTDLSYVKKQGINGPIWALIALDSRNYTIPVAPQGAQQVTRDNLIETILNAQLDNGGWTLSGNTADADMTAMALTALAPYYNTDSEIKTAVDQAIELLSDLQSDDGGFSSGNVATAESNAQVITALTALGIDPHTDSRFVKGGDSVVDALCRYYVSGGGFQHIASGSLDGMATEQGAYALTAYYRFKDGKTSLFNMCDVSLSSASGSSAGSGDSTDATTTAAKGWKLQDGKWYYHTADGTLAKGWLQIGPSWFYFDTHSAQMQTGWVNTSGKWYYLSQSGAMAVGWIQPNGIWYYLNPTNGAMQTGWVLDRNDWYYMACSGAMATGWRYVDGKWYCLKTTGELYVSTTTPDGYNVDATGAWAK